LTVPVDTRLLKQQHSEIIRAINDLCAIVDTPLQSGLPLVPNARLRVSQAIAANTASEASHIHGPLKAHRLTQRVPRYSEMEAITCELRLILSKHVTIWTMAKIEQDWIGYGCSLKDVTTRLADLLDLEERYIFPAAQMLLTGVGQFRQGQDPSSGALRTDPVPACHN
jgi:hypothetical protein